MRPSGWSGNCDPEVPRRREGGKSGCALFSHLSVGYAICQGTARGYPATNAPLLVIREGEGGRRSNYEDGVLSTAHNKRLTFQLKVGENFAQNRCERNLSKHIRRSEPFRRCRILYRAVSAQHVQQDLVHPAVDLCHISTYSVASTTTDASPLYTTTETFWRLQTASYLVTEVLVIPIYEGIGEHGCEIGGDFGRIEDPQALGLKIVGNILIMCRGEVLV